MLIGNDTDLHIVQHEGLVLCEPRIWRGHYLPQEWFRAHTLSRLTKCCVSILRVIQVQ